MSDNPYSSGFGYGAQTTGSAAPARPAGASGYGAGPVAPAPAAGDLIKDTTTAKFSADVIQESRRQPVLVDFWAPWCGPCKQLTPILEKVVKAANGAVKLVKMNIDEHPSIAGQLGVQSIPAVFAFVNGQPVDGFMGALPESEVKRFIERLGGGGPDPIAEALEEAGRLLAEGDAGDAAQLYAAILQQDQGNVGAIAGLGECYYAAGDLERAEAMLGQVPADKAEDAAVSALRTKLKLAAEIAGLGDPVVLQQRIESDAGDHAARYDLALIAQAKGDREQAAGHLLEIIRRDRGWNEDGARRKLLELFEVWGPMDPATKDARRRLSSLLFS
ncbi:thioredoxin [Mangrovibrevibacter kandeliae]|uniref:thioredoxin n=1 Tax=Mangrovibrevibacter kandeliae TaxID=2968473 RepID=UPI0021191034|nr:thioredoxin [Aurantimonas sp. CSK15Z-1]MCQ8781977.1 thioredoxin [Aurantimonas sp. CSK15Z-1]